MLTIKGTRIKFPPNTIKPLSGCLTIAIALALPTAQSKADQQLIFTNGFDVETFSELFPKDHSGWTNIQKTFPQNKADVVPEPRQGGTGALRLSATPSSNDVSKCDVERELPSLKLGQRVQVSAWFLIPPGQDINNLFLLDLECRECWPEHSFISNKSPGIRIRLTGSAGKPFVERRKIGHPDMLNDLGAGTPLPRGRWFKLDWRMTLSPDESGLTEILVDDEPVFRGRGTNFLDPQVFRRYGIQLRQVMYDRLQVGITANSSSNPVELFVDNVSVSIE